MIRWCAAALPILLLAGRVDAARLFPHKPHASQKGATCGSCHDPREESQPVRPKACARCHDRKPPKFASSSYPGLKDPRFSHAAHAKAGCLDCHADVARDAHRPGAPLLSRDACGRCHPYRPFSHKLHLREQECATCHEAGTGGAWTLRTAACGACHPDGPPPFLGPRVAKHADPSFRHERHVGKANCASCHAEILSSPRADAGPIATGTDCKACHSKPFSHAVHAGIQQQPCQRCHLSSEAGLPELDRATCDHCHESGPPAFLARSLPRGEGRPLPHHEHARNVPCAACHPGVLEDRLEAPRQSLADERCRGCHETKRLEEADVAVCTRCHATDRKFERPSTHDGNWAARHGADSRWRVFNQHGKSCAHCHTPSSCSACHQQSPPSNHNGLWRGRAHGLQARWDRYRCQACHETGVCIRCHSTTPPANHNGSWRHFHALAAGSAPNGTCNVCHSSGWCADCHSRK